jgi:broad specificity phosphatase PhoE
MLIAWASLVHLGALAVAALLADPLAALPPPPAAGLRVYLVRHGQAFSNLDPEPDLPKEQLDHLTDLGQRQADMAGAALRGREIGAVWSSPASRARETAARMASALGVPPPTVETRLRPLSLGRGADGVPLDWDARIADWEAGRDPSPPAGEALAQVGDRVADLVASLVASSTGAEVGAGRDQGSRAERTRNVVLVAHSEVIGAYLGRVRGTPPAKRYPPGIANGSITVVDVTAEGTREVLVNHRPGEP